MLGDAPCFKCESLAKEDSKGFKQEVWTLDSGKTYIGDLSQHLSPPDKSIRWTILCEIQ